MQQENFTGMQCIKTKKIQESTVEVDKTTYIASFFKGDKKDGDWVEVIVKSNNPLKAQDGEVVDWIKKDCQTSLDVFSDKEKDDNDEEDTDTESDNDES